MKLSTEELLDRLNTQQKKAVTHTGGPVLVLAGAGSGKTRAITYKVAYLIQQALARPEQILAVTFTNKAADEMRQRVLELVGESERPPLISTFHSFCVRVLRRYAPKLGWGHGFGICDADDQLGVYKQVYQALKLDHRQAPPVRAVRSTISGAKNKGWSPEDYLERTSDRDADLVRRIFVGYQKWLKDSNAMDFDDLLLHCVRLLRDFKEVRTEVAGRFGYLLIDEYQDTNRPQYELIRLLTCQHQNITAVGDEDQSIYRFRGADIENILRFNEDFPGAQTIKLERNYRSTQVILDAATAVVSNNAKRKGKVLWTKEGQGDLIDLFVAQGARDEAYFVAQNIGDYLRSSETRMAVLYRTNFQSRVFEEVLLQKNIPYTLVGGVSFYSRKEIKDALAYVRYLHNPRDTVSLLRIINEPPRGIGKRTLQTLQDLAGEESLSLHEAVKKAVEERTLTARAQAAVADFQASMSRCRAHLERQPLHLALDKILSISGYRDHLSSQEGREALDRRMNLEELVTVAREFERRGEGVQAFLDSCALYADSDAFDSSARVHLMTLHNAKGLEFDVVFLAGLEHGLFPHSLSMEPDDLEEERRLCYVGFTRARRRLYLSYARIRRTFGRDSQDSNRPSQFLSEVPTKLLRSLNPIAATVAPVPTPARYRRKGSSNYQGTALNTPEMVESFLQKLPARKPGPAGRLQAGALVEHDMFGRGKILRVETQGDDLKVTVSFSGIGIKKMLQSYARLRLI